MFRHGLQYFWIHHIDRRALCVGGDLIEDLGKLDFVFLARDVATVKSTTAILTILESNTQQKTVAVLTTLETPARSRVALLTNVESSPQKSTVAIVTILHVATPSSFSIIQMKGEPAMMRFHDSVRTVTPLSHPGMLEWFRQPGMLYPLWVPASAYGFW